MQVIDKSIGSKYKIVEITFHFMNYRKKGYDIMLADKLVYTIEPTFRQTDRYILYGPSISTMYFKNINQVIKHIK